MDTYAIRPDSDERRRIIAEAFGIPSDSAMVSWQAESDGAGARLTLTLTTHVDIDTINRIMNA